MICNCPKCSYAPSPTMNELQQQIEGLRKKLTELAPVAHRVRVRQHGRKDRCP